MGKLLRTSSLALALCLSLSALVVAQGPPDDRAGVRAAVETYLNGLKHNDVESLKKAFWADAKLLFMNADGTLGQLTQEQWYAQFKDAAGKESKAELKIASLDVTNDAASVKVQEDYATARYTDYLSLLRIGGKWQIVNKIYTVQRAAK